MDPADAAAALRAEPAAPSTSVSVTVVLDAALVARARTVTTILGVRLDELVSRAVAALVARPDIAQAVETIEGLRRSLDGAPERKPRASARVSAGVAGSWARLTPSERYARCMALREGRGLGRISFEEWSAQESARERRRRYEATRRAKAGGGS